jgi:hypothetical protein
MRRKEELAGHLGSDPRPISSWQRSAGRKASRRPDRREASCHLEPEWADLAVYDLERRPQSGRILIVTCWPSTVGDAVPLLMCTYRY